MRFDLLMLTVQCVHGSAMLDVCTNVILDTSTSLDDQLVCREVAFDAAELFAHGRESLIDLGASVELAVEYLRAQQ